MGKDECNWFWFFLYIFDYQQLSRLYLGFILSFLASLTNIVIDDKMIVLICNFVYSTEDGLRALILQRNKDREAASVNFFSALEAKYGGASGTKKRAKVTKKKQKSTEDEDEEEEEATASSSNRKASKRGKLVDEEDDEEEETRPKKRKNGKMTKRKWFYLPYSP